MMPLQVVAAFLESDRGIRDSGVCGIKGMICESRDPAVAQHFERVVFILVATTQAEKGGCDEATRCKGQRPREVTEDVKKMSTIRMSLIVSSHFFRRRRYDTEVNDEDSRDFI